MDLIEVAGGGGGYRLVLSGNLLINGLLYFPKRRNYAYKITTLLCRCVCLSVCLSVSLPASALKIYDKILLTYKRDATGDYPSAAVFNFLNL